MKGKILKALSPIAAVTIFSVALWFLYGEIQKYHYSEIISRMAEIEPASVALALLFMVANYIALTGFDVLALFHIGKRLSYPKIALTSFITYSFTHNIGFSVLSSGSVRYYLYSGFGLSALEIANVIVFCIATFIFGIVTVGGSILLLEPQVVPEFLTPSWTTARPLGVMLLAISTAYVLSGALRKVPVSIRGREFRLPGPGVSLGQLTVAALDWVFVSAILYTLLPDSRPGYGEFIGFFVLANFAAIMSHVPGGLGVFESVMLYLLSPYVEAGGAISALILWRGVYYILPFIVSLALFGAYEAIQRKESLKKALLSIDFQELGPHFIAVGAFAAGALLIMTGVLPASEARRAYAEGVFPRLASDAAHLMAGLAGAALILCPGGLQRRLKGAFKVAASVCALGIPLSLLRGLDYWVALYLAAFLAVLIPSRGLFYRDASVFFEPLSPSALSAFFIAVAAFLWLGFYMYGGASLKDFFSAGAEGRFARSLAATAALSASFFLLRAIKARSPGKVLAGRDLRLAKEIARSTRESTAGLALAGGRELFFSANGRAFIMYETRGGLRVAYGGPYGDKDQGQELIWRFHGHGEKAGGSEVFFSARGEDLRTYEDVGLAHISVGSEARIDLDGFRPHDLARERLLRLRREGLKFEVVGQGRASTHIVVLSEISKAWLKHTGRGERALVSGRFSPRYLNEFPLAVVRQGGRYIAFANMVTSAGSEEFYIDLIRHLPAAPRGILEFIFVNAALYGKSAGFRRLNLGLVPSGKTDPALPVLGSAGLYPHGEHFQDARELRLFKEGLRPSHKERFLCYPPGLSANRVLEEVAGLIEGVEAARGRKRVILR